MLQSQPLPEETTDMPEAQASVAVEQKSESYWQFVKRQFNRNIFGRISLYLVYFLVFVAIFADFLANEKPIAASYQGRTIFPVFKEYGVMLGMTQWDKDLVLAEWKDLKYDWAIFPPVPYSPETIDNSVAKLRERAPSAKHLWGTDETKRDVLAGVIHGSRYALAIGFVAMGIALAIGVVLGAIAGYYGGIVDILISRLIELVMTFPSFLLIITVVAMVQTGSLWLIMAVIGLTGWTSIARFIRGEVLRVRNLDFVTAASALGYSTPRIIFKHVLPNALGPVLVSAAFGIASAVLVESSLSFLGIGVPPTVVTWGSILNKARTSSSSWWLGVFPGLMIFLTVSAYNLIGDALRDATDPRLRS